MPARRIGGSRFIDVPEALLWLASAGVEGTPSHLPSVQAVLALPRPADASSEHDELQPTLVEQQPQGADVGGLVGPPPPLRVVTPQQLADELGMSHRWVRGQVSAGLPHLRFGQRLLIPAPEARAWLRERFRKPAADDSEEGVADGSPLDLLTAHELAVRLKMSDRWVREQVRLGLPHLKFGTAVRIEVSEARRWLWARYHVPSVGA